jgi:hypothetical protein
MKIKGIIYDVGLEYWPGQPIRKISEEQMIKEFKLIKEGLNCNAIGFHGNFNEKLLNATKLALNEGLEVWIFPRYINEGKEKTIKLFTELARKCEELRKKYERIVLGVGDELTVNCSDFFSGKIYTDRVRRLRCYCRFKKLYPLIMGEETKDWFFKFRDKEIEFKMLFESFLGREKIKEFEKIANEIEIYLKNFDKKLNDFLLKLVEVGRKNFKGRITYSAGCWEAVNWNIFDIIGIGLYLDYTNWFAYEEILRSLKERFNKPVVVTEFGAAPFKYASIYGGSAWSIFDRFEVERSEEEQAEHIERQFRLIKKANVDGCFLFIFTDVPEKIHVPNPKYYKEDYDMSGYGIMKIMPDGHLEPKKAFYTLKELYSKINFR